MAGGEGLRGNPFAPSGSPTPLQDGVTPIFIEHGADPSAAPGFFAAPGSILKFGSDYFEKFGPANTDWRLLGSGGSDDSFFRASGGFFIWGLRSMQARHAQTMGSHGAGTADRLRAYPQPFTRGGVIERMGWFNLASATGAEGYGFRWGIYANSNGNKVQLPGELLFDSGTYSSWPNGNGGANADSWRDVPVSLSVEAGSVLWLAWMVNATLAASAQQMARWQAIEGDYCQLVLGFQNPEVIIAGDTQYRMPATQSNMYGRRVDQAFGAMPATFPGGATLNPIGGDGVSSWPMHDPSPQWSGRIPLFMYEWTPS